MHDTYGPDCACKGVPPVHEDDSYGDCVICREYVTHTDDDYRRVRFPCARVLADELAYMVKVYHVSIDVKHHEPGSRPDICDLCRLLAKWEASR